MVWLRIFDPLLPETMTQELRMRDMQYTTHRKLDKEKEARKRGELKTKLEAEVKKNGK
jgi:hypothetical protein